MLFQNVLSSVSDTIGKFFEGLGGAKDFAFILLGAVVAVLVFAVFLIALVFARKSRTKELSARLNHVTAFVKRCDEIDKDNAPELYHKMKTLPEEIRQGWGNFLDREVGYPSEYFSEPEVLKERTYQNKARAGKSFYRILGRIVLLLGVGLAAVLAVFGAFPEGSLFTKAETAIELIVYVLSGLFIPCVVYIIFEAILSTVYKKQSKETMHAFRNFKDALDEKVSIYRPEMFETSDFYKENEEEINNAIEEIAASKIGNAVIKEVLPLQRKIEDTIIVHEIEKPIKRVAPKVVEKVVIKEEPLEEEFAETAATDVDAGQLEVLKGLVKNALSDKNATEEDLEDLQHYIMQAKIAGFKRAEDQNILAECIDKLNAYMIVVQGKPSELTALLYVIDNAVNDANVTKDDLLQLRSLILAAKESDKFAIKKDQKILTQCVGMLNNLYKK